MLPIKYFEPLSENDIEEQLSIAYVHAVCSHAKMCWETKGRLPDNRGIDGEIHAWKPFGPNDGYLKQVDLHVQLKATKKKVTQSKTHFSYPLASLGQYEQLREIEISTPRILVVLFLPPKCEDWLSHSPEQLLLKKCAYWVSLRGAATSSNSSGQTVYLPKNQPFNVESLRMLGSRLSRRDIPLYQMP